MIRGFFYVDIDIARLAYWDMFRRDFLKNITILASGAAVFPAILGMAPISDPSPAFVVQYIGDASIAVVEMTAGGELTLKREYECDYSRTGIVDLSGATAKEVVDAINNMDYPDITATCKKEHENLRF